MGKISAKIMMPVVILVLSGLFACKAVGPDYVPPPMEVPPELTGEIHNPVSGKPVYPEALANWWSAFDDPVLARLIARALDGGLDIKQALARIDEARARRGLSLAEYYPDLDATGSASRSRSSSGDIREAFSAGFDTGWEIDVFGGVRRSVAAAEANLEAAEAGFNDICVSLAAETAVNYVEARTLEARLNIARANLAVQSETFELVSFRFEAGLANELSFNQARYQVENTRAGIFALEAALEAAKNRLAVLTGRPPGAVHALMQDTFEIPKAPQLYASGIPADFLRRRPDIRKAERDLAAQSERIGVATAGLYPRFTLSGAIGFESGAADDLFNAGSRFWRVGPGVSWKVFDAGAVRRNIEIQSAVENQYLIAYEQSVLNALEEVKNAMTACVQDQLQQESLARAVAAARRAEELAREYYLAGMADFSEVLEAQRSVLNFESQLAQATGAVATDLIQLYKALGGGWKYEGKEQSIEKEDKKS
jgi:NodT family efflux transporter outer membrane factor (OMF) lipoprotein